MLQDPEAIVLHVLKYICVKQSIIAQHVMLDIFLTEGHVHRPRAQTVQSQEQTAIATTDTAVVDRGIQEARIQLATRQRATMALYPDRRASVALATAEAERGRAEQRTQRAPRRSRALRALDRRVRHANLYKTEKQIIIAPVAMPGFNSTIEHARVLRPNGKITTRARRAHQDTNATEAQHALTLMSVTFTRLVSTEVLVAIRLMLDPAWK